MNMITLNKNSLNSLLIFFTGLWFPKIGIPLFLFYTLYLFITSTKLHVTYEFVLPYIFLILFCISYIFFWNDPQIPSYASYYKDKELYMLLQLIVVITSVYWLVLFVYEQTNLMTLLYLFSLGMFLKSLAITMYTLLNAPYLLSMRQLLDPFSMQIINSPAISLMATFGVLFSLYFLFSSTKKKFLLHLAVVLLGLFIAFLLQARTFFVIFTIFSMYLIFVRFNLKNLLKLILVLPLLLFGLLYIDDYMMQNNEYYASTQENTIKRFQEEGVESNRFLQWSSALDIILDNPLGGSSTDKSIEKTHWFHNLWLDIGRTSGILPIILILIPQLYIFYLLVFSLIKKPNFEKHFLFIFYIALLIALFVEIALEGNIVLFVFHVFFIAVIFRYFRLENKTLEGEKLVCK